MQRLREDMSALDSGLRRTPENLEDLKGVLNVIATIRSTSMKLELQYSDLEERCRSATACQW